MVKLLYRIPHYIEVMVLNYRLGCSVKLRWHSSNYGIQPYVEVMVRNLSWPAVSQIWSLTRSPSMSTVRILKSTPMVVM